MSICKLCKKDRPLRNSHVIPAFVARWLRKTSATGNLRSSRQPNQLVQDTRKLPMLCHECEQRFGAWEAKFARCIFLPRHAGTSAAGNYGPWLRLFLASIAWRVATVQIANHTQVGSNYNNAAQSLEHWRRFLLDETTNFEEYTIHLLFLNATTLTSESLPKYYNHFLLRTTGYRLIVQPRVLAVLVKLPGMVVWLPILPRKPRGWVGTQVSESGCLAQHQEVTNRSFGNVFMQMAYETDFEIASRSDLQIQKSRERFNRNPNAKASGTWAAFCADEMLRKKRLE